MSRLTRGIALAVLVAIAATGAILSDMDFAYVNNLHGASGDTLVGAVYLTSSDESVVFGYDNVAGATPDTLDITAASGSPFVPPSQQGTDRIFDADLAADSTSRDSIAGRHRSLGAFHSQFAQWDSINGYWTGVTGGGTDGNAVHVNQAGEIAAITAKGTPTTSDYLVIEDAAASNVKKRITIGDLPSGGGAGLADTTDWVRVGMGPSTGVMTIGPCNNSKFMFASQCWSDFGANQAVDNEIDGTQYSWYFGSPEPSGPPSDDFQAFGIVLNATGGKTLADVFGAATSIAYDYYGALHGASTGGLALKAFALSFDGAWDAGNVDLDDARLYSVGGSADNIGTVLTDSTETKTFDTSADEFTAFSDTLTISGINMGSHESMMFIVARDSTATSSNFYPVGLQLRFIY